MSTTYTKIIVFSLYISLFNLYAEDKHFVFIIPSYNNEQWVEKSLDSIFTQNYDNYHILYFDDASTDNTGKKVQECCQKHNKADKLTYIRNESNRKALYSICNAIHCYCKDTDIVALLDGDDWLANRSDLLQLLNTTYQNPNVWITYGEFAVLSHPMGYHGIYTYPASTIDNNSFRNNQFYFAHLRTFYAKLFKKVHITEFMYNHEYIYMTWDMLFGLPMLEMAHHHSHYVPEVIHIYNDILATNDGAKDPSQQMYFDFYIRNKDIYKPLPSLFEDTQITTGLFYFCNSVTTEQNVAQDLQFISTSFSPISPLIGITHRNHQLASSLTFYGTTLKNCYYHSWLSEKEVQHEKQRIYNALASLNTDFIILTENGHGSFEYNTYTPDLLSLADIIVIGTYTKPLETGLFKKYPHVAFMPLNCLGQTLDLRKPSTVIIKKEKLLHAIEQTRWINGSYLSLLTAIDHVHGSQYGIFI